MIDIVGGGVVSLIGLKITFYFFGLIKKEITSLQVHSLNSNSFYLSLVVFLFLIILITISPSIDLFVSNIFYDEQVGFLLQSEDIITFIIRKLFLPFLILYILLLPILSNYLFFNKIYFKYKFTLKKICMLWVTMIFNIILVVNLLLKNMWGRSRPNDISEFSGQSIFTEWYRFSDFCMTNCSFVSGDAAVGFSLISFYFITKKIIYFWLSIVSGLILSFTRVLEGGHFLSDILFAGLIIFILNYFQFKLINKFKYV